MGGFDPSRFNNPVALRTDWTPLKAGGVSIEIQRLERCDYGMHFVPSPVARVLGWACQLFGVGTIGFFGPFSIEQGIPTLSLYKQPLTALVVGLVFAGIGAWTLHMAKLRNEFDTISGEFIQGNQPPLRLSEVHALQLLGELIQGNKGSYTSYELNLVLHSGERVNVVDQNNLDRLYSDAKNLAAHLDKPLWDITAK